MGIMAGNNQWMVRVVCTTYNHASYINDAMCGFTLQQTEFPFVCTIIDDASTDGEPEVIRHYLQDNFDLKDKSVVRNEETDDYVLCFARHKTNLNCYFAVIWLKYNHYSINKSKLPYVAEWDDNAKYLATCEGDDYWISASKLQKQVDVLESNSNIGLCYTNARVYDQLKRRYINTFPHPFISARNLLFHNPIMTLTTMFRKDLYNLYLKEIKPEHHCWKLGDYPLWIWLAIHSDVRYLDLTTSVYRKLENSASHSPDINKNISFIESINDVRFFFINKYFPEDQDLKDRVEDDFYRRLAYAFDENNDRENYIKYMKKCKKLSLVSRIRIKLCDNSVLYDIYRFLKKVKNHC